MDWGLQLSILAPALVAGLLVLATHIPLGREVLRRGIIFIDLAIAQIAGLGVIAAHTLGWEVHGWETQVIALSAALGGAALLGWAETHLSSPDKTEHHKSGTPNRVENLMNYFNFCRFLMRITNTHKIA